MVMYLLPLIHRAGLSIVTMAATRQTMHGPAQVGETRHWLRCGHILVHRTHARRPTMLCADGAAHCEVGPRAIIPDSNPTSSNLLGYNQSRAIIWFVVLIVTAWIVSLMTFSLSPPLAHAHSA